MKVAVSELKRLCRQALRGYGYDEQETEVILDVLMYAQLRGNNQGIVKLIGDGMPKNPEAGEIEVVRDTKLSVLLNGNQNAGIVVMADAMRRSLAKAEAHGFGIAGTHNTATSSGAIGYYVRQIAEAGLLGIACAGSPPAISVHGSYEPLFGTNPMAFGVPSTENPVVFDMATAAIAWYGLVEAKASGKELPQGLTYDSEGQFTTDPAKAMEGAILPFDRGYKGSGLAMMVEVLAGPLVGAAFANVGDVWGNWGNMILSLDPELLVDRDAFQENVAKLVEEVKSAQRLEGVSEIYAPGERGDKLAEERLAAGEIEVAEGIYAGLVEAAGEG